VCSERVLAGLAEGGFGHGADLLAAGDAAGLAACVAEVLTDAALRERLAAAARERLVGAYRWSANLERFEELLAAVVRRPAAPGEPPQRPAPRRTCEETAIAEGARSA